MPVFSVLILTKNEQKNIGNCIASVNKLTDDIVVFDSFSSDRTAEIAISMGCRVFQQVFLGYASQRNAALASVIYKYEWVFILDADERLNETLYTEIEQVVSVVSPSIKAFRLRRRDFMFGTWLKHAQLSPYFIRLVKPRSVHYEREINEVLKVEGTIGELKTYFDHYPFSNGLSYWIEKHNVYSSMEARRYYEEHRDGLSFSLRKALFEKDFNVRRFHQKGLFYKMPFRPLIKMLHMLILRRSFLDGKAGIAYTFLQAIYEYFIVLKSRFGEDDASIHSA